MLKKVRSGESSRGPEFKDLDPMTASRSGPVNPMFSIQAALSKIKNGFNRPQFVEYQKEHEQLYKEVSNTQTRRWAPRLASVFVMSRKIILWNFQSANNHPKRRIGSLSGATFLSGRRTDRFVSELVLSRAIKQATVLIIPSKPHSIGSRLSIPLSFSHFACAQYFNPSG